MPQLNPSPWFFIFLSSWIILLTFSPLKFPNHIYPNDPSLEPYKGSNLPWSWPWS